MPLNMYREAIELYPSAAKRHGQYCTELCHWYGIRLSGGGICQRAQRPHDGDAELRQTVRKVLIKELSILYNRARQAAITQEITEVCSGAKAQKQKRK